MRGSDYVVKRVAYAILTVFIAITLNFVLFRALSGDAVSALRCKQCSKAFKEAQRRDLGLDQSKWVQYRLYLPRSRARRPRQVGAVREAGLAASSSSRSRTRCR